MKKIAIVLTVAMLGIAAHAPRKPADKASAQALAQECRVQANAKGLRGAERKAFLHQCQRS